MRILVIGAGIFGLSTAYWCRTMGMDVTVVDAGPVPNPSSSSYGHHRLIRYPYGQLAGYANMIPSAFRAWDELFSVLGGKLYHRTGTLAIADRETGWIESSLPPMDELNVEYERISSADAESRYPFLRLTESTRCLYTPTGGVLLASQILDLLSAFLRREHVVIKENLLMTGTKLESASGPVARADAIVIATGAFSRLVPGTGMDGFRSTRQICAFPDVTPDWMRAKTGCPMILDLDEKNGLYLVPSVAGTPPKFGDHLAGAGRRDGADMDSDTSGSSADHRRSGGTTRKERSRLMELYRRRIREALPGNCSFRVCHYAMTADRRFIFRDSDAAVELKDIPGLPRDRRILEIGGGSGHGFKFGPLVGQVVARLLDGTLSTDAARAIITGRGGAHYRR